MQPTYLPWIGFFSLITKVDKFIFLDDAQFQRSSWHHRNKILINNKSVILSVPIKRNSVQQSIQESIIDDSKNWRKKHSQALHQSYAKHKHAFFIEEISQLILNKEFKTIADLNIAIIQKLCEILGFHTKFYRSSELAISLPRSEKLIELCLQVNCEAYYSPVGAEAYLREDNFVENNHGISLYFHRFEKTPYLQSNSSSFVEGLSIIDLLANVGINQTVEYINENHLLTKVNACQTNFN
jgi:hypothetical protein